MGRRSEGIRRRDMGKGVREVGGRWGEEKGGEDVWEA